jgi:hypothetical protein
MLDPDDRADTHEKRNPKPNRADRAGNRRFVLNAAHHVG